MAAVGAAFVRRMEDVLDLYAKPYLYAEPHDARRPVVRFDERPRQPIEERPGHRRRARRAGPSGSITGTGAGGHVRPVPVRRTAGRLAPRRGDRAADRRLLGRLEVHDTPEHGGWLNMAELESSILGRRCLDRRIPDREAPRRAIAARERARNAERGTVQWRFTVAEPRTKLHRLHPA